MIKDITEIKEAIEWFKAQITIDNMALEHYGTLAEPELLKSKKYSKMAISALKMVNKSKEEFMTFAEWVANEIFDDNWEYNKDAFAELACRRLEKLGIVKANGDEWELQKGDK